jgi:molybdopterin-synthase adenylyltransferase
VITQNTLMTDAELTRYSRHLLLNEWSDAVQAKLAAAKVLVVGMGGLGCPAAQQLVCAGVGTLTIADDDSVDPTNLMRQNLHTNARIGMAKVHSARLTLLESNPNCIIIPMQVRLTGEALSQAVAANDIVLDCTDTFASRHAINRACTLHRKPLVSGAAMRFDGQWIMFDTSKSESPCYECLFPEEGLDEPIDRCGVMGVFAPLTAQIGSLQAAAAIKKITGVGQVGLGVLQLFNALNGSWQSIRVPRVATCKVCAQAR